MSRTDTPLSDRDALKEEIKAELKHEEKRKKRLRCCGCLALWFIILLVPVIFAAVLVAKTGLVRVPLLSGRLYKAPEPVRQVVPLAGSTTETIMRRAVAGMKPDLRTGIAEISLNEAEITTLLSSAVAAVGASLPFPIKSVQAAVEPTFIELFLVSPQKETEVVMRVRVVPSIDAGVLQLSAQEVIIGSLTVPEKAAQVMLLALTKSLSDGVQSAVSAIGELRDVNLEQGKVIMVLRAKK